MNPFSGEAGNPNDPNNQMMLASLEQVNQQNLPFFLQQNPDLYEEQDNLNFKKASIQLIRGAFGVLVVGTFLNLQLKRIPQFLKWHFVFRAPIRIPVFLCPCLLFKSSFDKSIEEVMQMHMKYYKRILNTRRTGDLRYLDPQGVLAKQFNKKMSGFQ